MADIDEISAKLGELVAGQTFAKEWFQRHEQADQDRFEQLSQSIKKANGYNDRITQVEWDVKDFQPIANGVKRAKWIVIGVLATGSVSGGVLATIAAEVLKLIH